jgi:hypothetical protein
VCWAKLLGFTGTPPLAHAEIATFRNLVLDVAARITHSARQVQVRTDHTGKYAHDIAQAWLKIRAGPEHPCPDDPKEPGAADTTAGRRHAPAHPHTTPTTRSTNPKEPQKRAAPHLHTALRGSLPHEVIRQVTEATYHQVWSPDHDQLVYDGEYLPV